MKKIMLIGCIFAFLFCNTASANIYEKWINQYDEIVKKYVKKGTNDGVTTNLVDYKGLRRDARFTELFNLLGRADANDSTRKALAALGEKGRLAFWINFHNFLALNIIVNNPNLKSITDLDKTRNPVFKQTAGALHREPRSLDFIENSVIKKQFKDFRIRFALCNATLGSAPLRNEAYRGDSLDQQLDDQFETFTKMNVGCVVDNGTKTLSLSQVFDWYKDEFDNDPVTFLFKKKRIPLQSLEFQVDSITYNWALNCLPGSN